MMIRKTSIISSFTTRSVKGILVNSPAQRINQRFLNLGHNTAFRVQRLAGFTTLELLIVVAIIMIVAGMAVVNVRPAIMNLRANGAMYQTITSLREARMLAMSQDRMVSVQFPATSDGIAVRIRHQSTGDGDAARWETISVETAQKRSDPSMTLEYGYTFSRNNSHGAPPGGSSTDGAIVFANTEIIEENRVVFTGDGLLTWCDTDQINSCDLDSPINGTIYIKAPDGDERLARALTIRGATGSITAWKRKNDNWTLVR